MARIAGMRLVIQRVAEAHVLIQNQMCASIQKGLVILLGIHQADSFQEVSWCVKKLANLRIFSDEQGKMNLNIKDIKGQALIISQFTLYGNCLSGRRPDFIQAASPALALPLYEAFIKEVSLQQIPVETGRFGANMQVSLINDGPVTLILDSEKKNYKF